MQRSVAFGLSPLLFSAYPVAFLFHRNATVVALSSLWIPLAVSTLAAAVIFVSLSIVWEGDWLGAGNASVVLLAMVFLYGPIYDACLRWDAFPVDHLGMVPTVLVLGIVAARLVRRLGRQPGWRVWQATVFGVGAVLLFNIAATLPIEIAKARIARPAAESTESWRIPEGLRRPDIYYIILDEYAGFDAIREYWHYPEIDRIEEDFRDLGFFVANGSRSRTPTTVIEMASRLNYREYETDLDRLEYYEEMANNRVMRDLAGLGYVTVVLDTSGGPFGMPGRPAIEADFVFGYDRRVGGLDGLSADEFATMVLGTTIFRALTDAESSRTSPLVEELGDYILLTFDRIPGLGALGVPSPRFVYAHIMLPHMPFIFDKDGGRNDESALWDYHYYLGSYLFATTRTLGMVRELLASADPENPPIIIIQSDHGAKNASYMGSQDGLLPDYPDRYAYYILNALYLPGVDYSTLPDDLSPINTFPLILDSYFGYEIPLH